MFDFDLIQILPASRDGHPTDPQGISRFAFKTVLVLVQHEIATAWSGWQWEASLLVWPWDAWGGLPAAGVRLALQHQLLPGQVGQGGGGGEAAHLLLLPVAH